LIKTDRGLFECRRALCRLAALPYREHALISHQEHEAWDVLLACGHLRLAPSGQVIGIDMDAVLKIGATRGSDLAALSELLRAAEAGSGRGAVERSSSE
jgi:hypothetical protein